MWRRVDIVLTDVSEERIASIFRVEEKEGDSRKVQQLRVQGIEWSMSLVNYED
jgi:hypothetical protein